MPTNYPVHLQFVRMLGSPPADLPLFWGGGSDSIERIEAEGIEDYYLLAQERLPAPTTAKTDTILRPTIFRVTATVMGRAITLVDVADSDLFATTAISAQYNMPPIPWDMVRKMDEFFRAAYDRHGTEAILILTYTPSFFTAADPSAGWHCVAPKQTNSIASCKYDPSSVQERKAVDDIIVGTMHSHPEMTAFFSGTDHDDQEDWDGVHITQAWKGKGATEYHIAMILGGKEWVLQPNQVFGSPPVPNYDATEVDTWLESVEKKPTTTYGSGQGTFDWQKRDGTNYSVPLIQGGFTPATKVRAIRLPADAPDPRNTYIVPEYSESILDAKAGSAACRLCDAPLLSTSIEKRRCMACSGFILLENETVEDLFAYRKKHELPYHLTLDVEKAQYPIVIWALDNSFGVDQRSTVTGVAPKA